MFVEGIGAVLLHIPSAVNLTPLKLAPDWHAWDPGLPVKIGVVTLARAFWWPRGTWAPQFIFSCPLHGDLSFTLRMSYIYNFTWDVLE